MDSIVLAKPTKAFEAAAQEYIAEHIAAGEADLHGASLLEKKPTYDDWLRHLQATSDAATVDPGWVVASTFFAVRAVDSRLIGVIDIRHRLNDFLYNYGGHIGYGVRPTERRKGYATEILRLGLDYCKTIGLQKVMLACYKDNVASAKTILKNGGELKREFTHTDGVVVQVYWAQL